MYGTSFSKSVQPIPIQATSQVPGLCSSWPLHNSDLRDSLKYTKKQVWAERILTRQSSKRLGSVRTRLTEACSFVYYDSAHTTYLETIFVLSDVFLI